MGFPDIICECAFNNAADETLYATQGWAEVTPWVKSMSGPLRGRQYEVDRSEAGTLTVVLDNTDGEFTPGNPTSPFYPNLKANRRFRVRGKNMVAPNIARGGGADHSTQFFERPTWGLPNYTNGVSAPVWKQHDPAAYPGLPAELTDHIEITVDPAAVGGVTGYRRLLSWVVPVEVGVRLTHSAYIWKVSGTEPGVGSGHDGRFEIWYFDNDDEDLVSQYPATMVRAMDEYLTGTPTVPTRKAFSHAPIGTVKYARVAWAVDFTSLGSGPVTYAITGIQSELPVNLAPNPNADWDALHWLGRGGTETPVSHAGWVGFTWGGSVSLYQTVPHLIPGQLYAVTARVNLPVGHGPVMLTADGGATGESTSAINTWTDLHTFFTAGAPQNDIELMVTDGSDPTGLELLVRGLNVQAVEDSSVLLAPEVLLPQAVTAYERPMDIFEGWVERWPWKVDSDETTITVVDRMKRVGGIVLANVISETLNQDTPALVVPFNDDLGQATGNVAWYGSWAQDSEAMALTLSPSKGDILTANYQLGAEGPTEEPAIQFNPASNTVGYYIKVPYSPDYATPPPVVVTPPPSTPPSSTTKTTYTKTYYATWSRSYDSDGTTRFDDTPYLYHGCYFCSNNQRALIGFNYTAIKADLAGADIKSVYFVMKNAHARWNAGLYTNLGTHIYASKPGTWSGGSVTENRWKIFYKELEKKSVGLPTSVGYDFKAGTTKGIAIGPAPSDITDNYGYFYGATQSYKPYLTITYVK